MRLNMKFVILLILYSSLLMSCKKESREGPYIYDTDVFVNVLDEKGNDLLDPTVKVEKSIDINKLQLIYILGDKELIQSPGATLVKPTGEYKNYSLHFAVNSDKRLKEHVTLLKWNSAQADTIKSTIYFTEDSTGVFCRQLIHDNVIVWDSKTSNTIRKFTITK